MELEQPVLAVHGGDGLVGRQVQHHGVEFVGDLQLFGHRDKTGGVFGTGEFFLEGVQPKAVVDALVEDAAQLVVPLQDQQVLHAVPAGLHSGRQPGGAAADDNKIYVFHGISPLQRVLVGADDDL